MEELPETNRTRALITGGLKSVGSSFPGLASIATAWSEYDTFKQDKRVTEFIENMCQRLDAAEDNLIALIKTVNGIPDLAETLERCVEASIREVVRDKRRVFSDVYCSFLENQEETNAEQRLNIILPPPQNLWVKRV